MTSKRRVSCSGDGRQGSTKSEVPMMMDVHACAHMIRTCRLSCNVQKKPDGGNMKAFAFAYDPDGYWVEVCLITRPQFGRFTKSVCYHMCLRR